MWKIHSRLPVRTSKPRMYPFALRIVFGDMTRPVRGADDHDVAGDERRGVQAELGGDEIDLLIVVELQIDDAVVAEGRRLARRSSR